LNHDPKFAPLTTMPIVDVQLVCKGTDAAPLSAQALADALGRAFGTSPGRTWVRVHTLIESAYAENQLAVHESELPAFVTIVHAHPPVGEALAVEVLAVTQAVATVIGRSDTQVHVQYSPAGAGRQAFGGKLVE
jgi:phenylpyruvate tautomerase PptA (4-oxalocrotonate tautomerase family)